MHKKISLTADSGSCLNDSGDLMISLIRLVCLQFKWRFVWSVLRKLEACSYRFLRFQSENSKVETWMLDSVKLTNVWRKFREQCSVDIVLLSPSLLSKLFEQWPIGSCGRNRESLPSTEEILSLNTTVWYTTMATVPWWQNVSTIVESVSTVELQDEPSRFWSLFQNSREHFIAMNLEWRFESSRLFAFSLQILLVSHHRRNASFCLGSSGFSL